ncbi:MAG: phosphonopyruvate decarboxylase [Rhodospirillales bacterium]|nr:phosphonopyruvate decarboxylase [Rhodospirillales bacterium]MCK5778546.1 phosphonopyruvate decarboxylase [Rhodospirillales bacterium]
MEWGDDIYKAIKEAGVGQVAYVPDAGHKRLINACIDDNDIKAVSLTTEEEGIALSAGAWLGGEKCVMLMQSSGVGNCINMLSLIETCRFPFCAFVTMRGQWHEFNPWQMPMGTTTKQALQTAGCLVDEVEDPSDVGAKAAATIHKAFVGQQSSVLLLSQRMVPIKTFGK